VQMRVLTRLGIVLIASVLPVLFFDLGGYTSSAKPSFGERELEPKNQLPYRPHILFVIVDDLGSHDLGMHGTGINTPVADGLARDGLYLDQFYVHPCCTPTRVALMTGRFPYSMGISLPLGVPDTGGIPLDEETLPQVLNKVGYQSHIVGKWSVDVWRSLFMKKTTKTDNLHDH